MVVQCPSCSTGYHLALPAPAAVLRCSRCREVVPPPAHRRRYVLDTPPPVAAAPAVSGPALEPVAWVPEPVPPAAAIPAAPVLGAAAPPPPTPTMAALDAALFGPGSTEPTLSVRSSVARPRPSPVEPEPADATALVPLGLAAVGAAAAWFAAPDLAAWTAPLPFAVEPWMMGAAGAACGLLLGGMWVKWRAARR